MSNIVNDLFRAYTTLEFSDEDNMKIKKGYLDDIKEFVLGGTYTSTKHKDYLLRNYMKPIQDQASDLNLSKAAVYKNRALIVKDLENRIGKNIVKDILNSRFEEVDTILRHNAVNQTLSSVVIRSVVDSIKERDSDKKLKTSTYTLMDCKEEIKLLKKYSMLDLEVLLDNLDADKLNYLLRLINFEESNVGDRVMLMELIKR